MLPEKNKRPNIIRYYESLKNLHHTSTDPFFWFQYAIARLFFKEYEKAGIFFETAYSYARKKYNFNTFQIDNHYARYLLERAVVENDETKCMRPFRDAHEIISRQIKDETKHYPYRVATSYAMFIESFYNRVSPIEQQIIKRACKYVLDFIARLPQRRRENRYVNECEIKLKNALEKI